MGLVELHFTECYESRDRRLKDIGDSKALRGRLLSISEPTPLRAAMQYAIGNADVTFWWTNRLRTSFG